MSLRTAQVVAAGWGTNERVAAITTSNSSTLALATAAAVPLLDWHSATHLGAARHTHSFQAGARTNIRTSSYLPPALFSWGDRH